MNLVLNDNYIFNMFRFHDQDRDGFLTMEQVRDAAIEIGMKKTDLADVTKIPISLIVDEVKAFNLKRLRKNPFKEIFKRIDIDGSGRIDFFEAKMMMSSFGVEMPDSKVENFFRKADTNRDGYVDLNEYLTYMQGLRDNFF